MCDAKLGPMFVILHLNMWETHWIARCRKEKLKSIPKLDVFQLVREVDIVVVNYTERTSKKIFVSVVCRLWWLVKERIKLSLRRYSGQKSLIIQLNF